MPHSHPVVDSDPHFKIDKTTRAIIGQSTGETVLIQGDHNSERLTFEIPRFVDGHDMSLCDRVEIHYTNINATSRVENKGVYIVDDANVSGVAPDEIVTFSWLISSAVTQYSGPLSFLIRFVCTENGKILYAWNTGINKDQSVGMSIYNSDTIVQEFPDILAQIQADLKGKLNNTGYLPNKILGTDEKGKVVEKEVSNDGSGIQTITKRYQWTKIVEHTVSVEEAITNEFKFTVVTYPEIRNVEELYVEIIQNTVKSGVNFYIECGKDTRAVNCQTGSRQKVTRLYAVANKGYWHGVTSETPNEDLTQILCAGIRVDGPIGILDNKWVPFEYISVKSYRDFLTAGAIIKLWVNKEV